MFFIYAFLGLAMFLLGIKLMSDNFKDLVSTSFKNKINSFTSNKLLGVLTGIVVTAILHSSSAATLIVIGLVHSDVLSLYNAVPIIMGANIGTTFTSQLIAFNFDLNPMYLLLLGIFLYFLFRKTKFNYLSKLVISISLIFLGLNFISGSITPLKDNDHFYNFISLISKNRLLSLIGGAVLTAIIQSSTTGIAMIQIMATNGLISVKSSIPIVIGQNIGTCLDTVIGGFATNKSGRQTALVHVLFNLIGSFVFFFLIDYIYIGVTYLSPDNISRQIANTHTVFNLLSTIILLPFSNTIANIAKKIIK